MIGFNTVDYTIDENVGILMLSVSVLEGSIPEAETRIIMLTTTDDTAECMLYCIYTIGHNTA